MSQIITKLKITKGHINKVQNKSLKNNLHLKVLKKVLQRDCLLW